MKKKKKEKTLFCIRQVRNLGTYLKNLSNRYLKNADGPLAPEGSELRERWYHSTGREFYYIRANTHDVEPGQADTWTGNDDLPLFGKVNSSIKLNRSSCVCAPRHYISCLSAAFMNRRALWLRPILPRESRRPIPRYKTKSSYNRFGSFI